MLFTMENFQHQYAKDHFLRLTPEEQVEVLRNLPPEQRLAGVSADEIRQYPDRLSAERPARTASRGARSNGSSPAPRA